MSSCLCPGRRSLFESAGVAQDAPKPLTQFMISIKMILCRDHWLKVTGPPNDLGMEPTASLIA